jgi:hypothetical protein
LPDPNNFQNSVTRYAGRVLLVLTLFALYVWLCRRFFIILEIDACLDAGGSFDYAAGRCVGPNAGDLPPLALRAPFSLWLLLLGLPALAVGGLDLSIKRLLQRWGFFHD